MKVMKNIVAVLSVIMVITVLAAECVGFAFQLSRWRKVGGLQYLLVRGSTDSVACKQNTQQPGRPETPLYTGKAQYTGKASDTGVQLKDNRVVFENEPVDIPAEVVLSSKSNMEAPERDRAIEWLKKLLADGKEMPTREIEKMAAAEGFREHTLRKARENGNQVFP